ncbi:MAG: cysteine protease [Acidobacteria bacterium]|nr:cysteine protease [Acidobacteriota bacterium]
MTTERYAMGWQRDVPDIRDYSPAHEEIVRILGRSKALKRSKAGRAPSCDLTQWCSPVENQGAIGSCTAHAGVGLIEYFERRAFGKHVDASRLFLYKVTRNLLHWTGDTGAWLRTTMKAMVLFGVPPEEYYAYDTSKFEREPNAFCYAFAQNYQSIKYYRLDGPGITPGKLLDRIKSFLAAGHPSMFGFTVYSFGNEKGEFAFPGPSDSVKGGHAVMAVGYDDKRKIGKEKGALKIRNSWGTGWGENGYGWLPYRYVEAGLAVDFWSLYKHEYVDTHQFD